MKTAEQRKDEFLQELKNLCIKHKCELSISDDGKPYGAQSPIAVLCFDGVYDVKNETLEEFGCFVMDGFYFDSKE